MDPKKQKVKRLNNTKIRKAGYSQAYLNGTGMLGGQQSAALGSEQIGGIGLSG